MDRMYLLEIDFQLRPEKRREFNRSLESLLCPAGCGYVRASAYEDRDDGNRLLLVWEWNESTEVDAYLKSESYAILLGCLKTLGSVIDCRIVDLSSSARLAGTRTIARWVHGMEAPEPADNDTQSPP